MRTTRRRLSGIWLAAAFLLLVMLESPRPVVAQGPYTRAEALVIVNSASPAYGDFQRYVQPYLDHFGLAYIVLDISRAVVPEYIDDFALIVTGHRQLDTSHAYLDPAQQGFITAAVGEGAGFVNFDNALSDEGLAPRYYFVQAIFNFGYGGATSASGVGFPASFAHYITERHTPGEFIATGQMRFPGVSLPDGVTALAASGDQPFIAATTYGAGRAVQFGSYDWMSTSVHGPVFGFDDLVWRSFVWAARKPFVMRGMPPFVTMRVDDETGPLEWIRIANEFGFKPWAGLFIDGIDARESAELAALTQAGQATVAIHAFNDTHFFYFDHQRRTSHPDSTVANYFAAGTQWHRAREIPISSYVLPHYYEFGPNVFAGLSDWGVEFVGAQQVPGQPYRTPWIMNGPFRKYEAGNSGAILPVYYADFVTVPNRPEFNGRFFNCVTEIRDDAGYEWYPDLQDVSGTIGRGTRQLKRALDGMELATLFTHGYYVSNRWGPAAPENWRSILAGITGNLRAYAPIYVTMDYACRYVRATSTSSMVSATHDLGASQVTVTLSGLADIPTQFFLFLDAGQVAVVDVPAFDGSTSVGYFLPRPLEHRYFVPLVVWP